MKKLCRYIFIWGFLLISIPFTVEAGGSFVPASLSVLVEESPERDGKSFFVQGELVGEPLLDSSGVWLNILEDGNPMAIFCDRALASMAVQLVGGTHGRFGNRIRVGGILRRICPDHGGDLDFHATSCEVFGTPQEIPDLPQPVELIVLSLLILGIWLLTIRNAPWRKAIGNE